MLSFGIVLFSLIIGGIIVLGSIIRLKEEEVGQRLLITARNVAEISMIKQALGSPDGWKTINSITKRLRIINDVTYIVVMDMSRVRLSDPIQERIGKAYNDKDADLAFTEHTYTSKVRGDLGTAVRAYVPIMNEEHQQIGVVMAGHILPSIEQILLDQKEYILITFFFSTLFGIWGSWRLAKHMKKQMFELEPHEIARILRERTATFHAMHEGVIAIDNQERITIFNEKAKEIFGISGDVLGRNIREVIPDTRLPEILELQQPVYNQELNVGNAIIMSNRIPIKVNNQAIGALAVFQDLTEVTKLAEELTGVRAFVDALRVQNHEHMNKLHTIAGLLQLGASDKALEYLFQITEQQKEITTFLTDRIRDESISGLLLSKVSRGKELGIKVTIDRRSNLERFPVQMDHHDFVLLIGNLIENAFDALEQVHRKDKEVYVSIEQDDEVLSIMVEDNGCGMSEEVQQRMLERGFSTKQRENRGIGLHLVSQIVEKAHGDLRCESAPGMGTSFILTFPMKGGKE